MMLQRRCCSTSPKLELPTRSALFSSAVTPPSLMSVCGYLMDRPGKCSATATLSSCADCLSQMLCPRAIRVPLPVAHWCTGCWKLDLVARRARLSLLVSLVQAGPPLLWAMLQEEASWLRVLQKDLSWFTEPAPSKWPLPIAQAWPEWHHLLRTAAPRFKRSLRKRLDQAHAEQSLKDAAPSRPVVLLPHSA